MSAAAQLLFLALAGCTAEWRFADGPPEGVADSEGGTETGVDSGAETGRDTGADSGEDSAGEPPVWVSGDLATLPPIAELHPLPGGGVGVPVFTSNNPETFESLGFLYEVARADPARGGESWPLTGDFDVYFHHLNGTGAAVTLHLLVTNPGDDPLFVSGAGSAYTQSDYPLGRGTGPDYHVAEDQLTGGHTVAVGDARVEPLHALSFWSGALPAGQEVDAHFRVTTSAPAYVYLVAAASGDTNEAVGLSTTAATGDLAVPGDPPPPYGREAGVYAHDTWLGIWDVTLGGPRTRLGYMFDTATGLGWSQVQAFPALTHFADSSTEAVGMYGNRYHLQVTVAAAPGQAAARPVEVWLVAYGSGSPSNWFNGPVELDGALVPVWLSPQELAQRVGAATVPADGSVTLDLEIPIPGLSAIPFALYLYAPP